MPAALKYLTDKRDCIGSILAKWPFDGLYYQVDFVDIDPKKRRCLVRFEDKQEHWTDIRDLHLQLSMLENDKSSSTDDIICCVCDGEISDSPNEIVICDVCEQGFHQNCHETKIENSLLSDEEWTCNTCRYICGAEESDNSKKPISTEQTESVVNTTSDRQTVAKTKKSKSIEEVVGSLKKQSIEQTKDVSKDTKKDHDLAITKVADVGGNNVETLDPISLMDVDKPKSSGDTLIDRPVKKTKNKDEVIKNDSNSTKQKVKIVEKPTKKEKVKKENVISKRNKPVKETKRTSRRKDSNLPKKQQRSEPQEQSDTSCETVTDWEVTLPAPITNNPFVDD